MDPCCSYLSSSKGWLVGSSSCFNLCCECICSCLCKFLLATTWLKVYGHMGLVVVQGTVMASAIAVVEELLFRSWLPQEIEVDLGYHQGIIISGLAFSFLQRFVFFSGIKTFVYCINKLHLVNRYGLIHSQPHSNSA